MQQFVNKYFPQPGRKCGLRCRNFKYSIFTSLCRRQKYDTITNNLILFVLIRLLCLCTMYISTYLTKTTSSRRSNLWDITVMWNQIKIWSERLHSSHAIKKVSIIQTRNFIVLVVFDYPNQLPWYAERLKVNLAG